MYRNQNEVVFKQQISYNLKEPSSMSMTITRDNINKILTKYRNSHCKKRVHRKKPVVQYVFNKVYYNKNRCFPVKFPKIWGTLILKNICKRMFWEYFDRTYWTPPFLDFNFYILFNFSTTERSKHGILQEIMSNTCLLYMTHLTEKEKK